jgi:hypothetical protein
MRWWVRVITLYLDISSASRDGAGAMLRDLPDLCGD